MNVYMFNEMDSNNEPIFTHCCSPSRHRFLLFVKQTFKRGLLSCQYDGKLGPAASKALSKAIPYLESLSDVEFLKVLNKSLSDGKVEISDGRTAFGYSPSDIW